MPYSELRSWRPIIIILFWIIKPSENKSDNQARLAQSEERETFRLSCHLNVRGSSPLSGDLFFPLQFHGLSFSQIFFFLFSFFFFFFFFDSVTSLVSSSAAIEGPIPMLCYWALLCSPSSFSYYCQAPGIRCCIFSVFPKFPPLAPSLLIDLMADPTHLGIY